MLLGFIEGIEEESGKSIPLQGVAAAIGISYQRLSSFIRGRASVTPELAVRLSLVFEHTNAEFWLNLQRNYDMAELRKKGLPTNTHPISWAMNGSRKESVKQNPR